MDDLGASTVSSGASSAPPPDTAATSAPPAADAAPAPAAPQSTEVAASTETGAPAEPSSLDEIFQRFKSAPQEEAAPAAVTPEAKPDAKPAGEEKPAEVQDEEADAEEAKAEPDPLDDEPTIPTRDEINERFARAPKGIRDLAADLAEKAAAGEAVLAKIGGDEGLQVAEAIIPHLFDAAPSPESANAMFDALVEANAPLVATMGEAFVNAALGDEKTGPAFADRLLEGEFGEGYNAELLGRLAEAHRQGLIDLDNVEADLTTPREPTARESELESKLKAAESRVKELTGGQEDATRREEQRLAQTVKQTVSQAVMAKVLPIAERIGWVEREGAKGPHAGLLARLGKLATAELNAEIETTPEYDAIQQLVTEGRAFQDGKPTRLMRVKIEAVQRRSEAMFKKTARDLRPAISLLAGQNAQVNDAPPQPHTAGRSEGGERQTPAPEAQQQKPQTLEEIHEQFVRKQRDAAAPVGTLRR